MRRFFELMMLLWAPDDKKPAPPDKPVTPPRIVNQPPPPAASPVPTPASQTPPLRPPDIDELAFLTLLEIEREELYGLREYGVPHRDIIVSDDGKRYERVVIWSDPYDSQTGDRRNIGTEYQEVKDRDDEEPGLPPGATLRPTGCRTVALDVVRLAG